MAEPLEEVYPIVYLDAMMVKMRDNGHVQNQAIYVVLGVDARGRRKSWGYGWRSKRERNSGCKC
jgi:putative transposase